MSILSFRSYQVKGKGVGGRDVVPTINLAIPDLFDLPKGVYAGRVSLCYSQGVRKLNVALHYGPRPTDQDSSPSLELHVLDGQKFETDYNADEIDVDVVHFIRDINKFDDFIQLRDQIQKDIVQIRKILQ